MSDNKKASELRAEAMRLLEEAAAITRAEDDAANAKLIGRAFKYRNCYACPSDDSDYWYAYQLCIGADDGEVLAIHFERDKAGNLRAYTEASFASTRGEEITLEEFNAARDEFEALVSVKLHTKPIIGERRDD